MALIGNKVIEHDLRAWLDSAGHYGRSAELEELELAAVRRPGWEQVFRFRVRAKSKSTGEWETLRGLARDDERAERRSDRTAYRLTPTDADHDAAFAEWSDGLIKLRTGASPSALPAVLTGLGLAAAAAAGVALATRFF